MMMTRVILYFLLYSILGVNRGQSQREKRLDFTYCDGEWITVDERGKLHNTDGSTRSQTTAASFADDNYVIHGARTVFDRHDIPSSVKRFVRDACPAQQASYTCYYQSGGGKTSGRGNDKNRPKLLEHRHFIPNNPNSCSPFHPLEFLKMIAHRRILMLGDSMMGQTWESLVCSLYKLEGITTHIHTYFDERARHFNDPLVIPIPIDPGKIGVENPLHAHIVSGYLTIKEYNTSITFVSNPPNNQNITNYILPMIYKYSLTKDDIVIFNVGLHYNKHQYNEFINEIIPLKKHEIQELFTIKNIPLLFLTETTPQHYSTSNGYFIDDNIIKRKGCTLDAFDPTAGYTLLTEQGNRDSPINENGDWRNDIIHKLMDNLVEKGLISIIPVNKMLRSQYDAHVDSGDCTHWCFPSGIDKYLHLIYFNSIQRRLQQEGRFPQQDNIRLFQPDSDDLTWRLYPGLRNDDIVCMPLKSKRGILAIQYNCYRIRKGKFHPYYDERAFEYYVNATFDQVKLMQPKVKIIECSLEIGEFVKGSAIFAPDTPTFRPTTMTKSISKLSQMEEPRSRGRQRQKGQMYDRLAKQGHNRFQSNP